MAGLKTWTTKKKFEEAVCGNNGSCGGGYSGPTGKNLAGEACPSKGRLLAGEMDLPRRGLKLGEKIEEGIKREVREETGLKIRLLAPLIPFDRVVKDGEETRLHVIYIDYLAELVGGELKPASDVGEATWVGKEDLPRIWGELHDDTKRLLQIVKVV